ncbi:MAG: hypothetical protein ACJ8EW_04160 [Rhizobium sp.]|uniref:hypothetical protein n=1 Tax=Rhizobium sp. TaxID=391 RepID=UPI00389A0ED0
MPKFMEIRDWSPGYLNVTPQHVEIMAECQACGEQRKFDRRSVPASMRQHLISEIEPHLKCAACGAKAGKLRFGSFMEED